MVTLFPLTAQTSTNRAQTNGTGLDRFGRHGVESDVTGPFCICYFWGREIYLTFISTAQIEHKQMTPVLCDLDELGWRVTSQLPNIFWLYLRKENRCSVCFNGTNQHKRTALVWSNLGNMGWRVTSHGQKKRIFSISKTKPAQTFVFAAQISTNVAQTNGIVLVIISFYGVPTSRRCKHSQSELLM